MLSWCSLIKVEHKFYCKASLKKIVTFNFAENWFKKFYIYFYKTVLVAWLQYCKYRLMLSWCSLIKVERKFYCKASLKKILTCNFAENSLKKFFFYFYKTFTSNFWYSDFSYHITKRLLLFCHSLLCRFWKFSSTYSICFKICWNLFYVFFSK